ncbi:MAG: hypothetical protein ACLPV8_27330 [Steroidobacteraceae bacterium]
MKTVRRSRVFYVASALLTAAALGPRFAAAKQANPCDYPTLLRADEKRLIATARRVLPPHFDPNVSGQCRWADGAFALITTEKVTEDHGVTHWWVSSCSRDERDWACRPAEFQQEMEMRLIIDGIPRSVRLNFDGETSADLATALATAALPIYANPEASLPYCGGIKGQESRWRNFRESHPLPSGSKEIHVTVVWSRESETVWFGDIVLPDDIQIGIDFPIEDGNQSARCWSAR